MKRGAGPIAHPNGTTLLVASALGSRPMTTDSTEPKKAKLDTNLAASMVQMTCLPQTAAAVCAQQATAAGLRAANAAASAGAILASTSQTDFLGNMGIPSLNRLDSSNDSQSAPFSKVVHLRNIPSDMTELELVHFCLPFGKLVNYLMLKGKNQAFVEYEDEIGARTIVNVANVSPIAIRGRTIFCQFSTHQELKTDRKGATNKNGIFGDTMLSVSVWPDLSSPRKAFPDT
uniref:RRM domain-containing protein n=1 Tax=Panagrolaimus sp. JU765 TaxID=591449 RepID=A0AC34R3H1_9BILA